MVGKKRLKVICLHAKINVLYALMILSLLKMVNVLLVVPFSLKVRLSMQDR